MPRAPVLSSFTADVDKHDDTNTANDSDDDGVDGDENLRQMSVKSLTNLASYPNPMQKNAQRLLSRARPLAASTNMGPVLRAARSDPVVVTNLLQSDGVSEHDYSSAKGSTFSTILSKGLGAPQPLKAGPPGLRQAKSTTLDHRRGYTTLDRHVAASSYDDPMSSNAIRQHRYAHEREPSPSHIGDNSASVHAMLGLSKAPSKITDSLTEEEARQYYHDSLPINFNTAVKPIMKDWTEAYPLNELGVSKDPSRILKLRQAEADAHWYSGNEMFNKTIDQAIWEKQHRDFQRTVGVIGGERKQAKRKPDNRKLTVHEANSLPLSDHAAPLLSMAFQTLINHPEFGDNPSLPKFGF